MKKPWNTRVSLLSRNGTTACFVLRDRQELAGKAKQPPTAALWRCGCSPGLLVLAEGGDAAAQGVQGGVDVVGFFHSVPAFLVLAALGPRQVTQG